MFNLRNQMTPKTQAFLEHSHCRVFHEKFQSDGGQLIVESLKFHCHACIATRWSFYDGRWRGLQTTPFIHRRGANMHTRVLTLCIYKALHIEYKDITIVRGLSNFINLFIKKLIVLLARFCEKLSISFYIIYLNAFLHCRQ